MNKWIDEGVCLQVFDVHVYRCPLCRKTIIEAPGYEPRWCPGCGEVINADAGKWEVGGPINKNVDDAWRKFEAHCSFCNRVFLVPKKDAIDYICDDCYELYGTSHRKDGEQDA